MIEKNFTISILIPTFNDSEQLKELLNHLLKQSIKPNEIIIVDSSNNDLIKKLVNEFNFHKIKFIYKKILPSFAGKSINIGSNLSECKYIAFLDTKTIPDNNWIEYYMNVIIEKKINLLFGSTKYISMNYYQHLLRSSSYGSIGHETVPGTIIEKSLFLSLFLLLECSIILFLKMYPTFLILFLYFCGHFSIKSDAIRSLLVNGNKYLLVLPSTKLLS